MRRLLLLLIVLLAAAGCGKNNSVREGSLRKAAEYLWAQQDADGGWHSHTYGLLKSGQSMTPFVLHALLTIPQQTFATPNEKVDRALGFIKKNTSVEGGIGMADPLIPDYPNYATSLAVLAIGRAQRSGWEQEIAPLIGFLRGQQFTETNGWSEHQTAYGAWGMGGVARTPPGPGHVDLSMTKYVLQALSEAGVPSTDAAFARARIFVERCQNPDGGFFFSPVEADINKAGEDAGRYRSYGTATADGIVALLATGHSLSDPHLEAAAKWLEAHHRAGGAPGFVGDAYKRWPEGLRFYYYAAGAQAYRSLQKMPPSFTIDELVTSQRTDGSWSNPENLVKEDDPLIATGFAIRALVLGLELN